MKTCIDFVTAPPRMMVLMFVMAFLSAHPLAQSAPNMLGKRVRHEVLDIAKDNKGKGHHRWLGDVVAESML